MIDFPEHVSVGLKKLIDMMLVIKAEDRITLDRLIEEVKRMR